MNPAVALIALAFAATTDDDALARLRQAEARRRQLVASLEPAVCAVMSLKQPGGGSGVIFSPRGWILTNYHVTGDAKTMKIGLPDGRFYLADVTGIDPGGDIAVCALRDKGPLQGGAWPHVTLGDSDKLRLGGLAYAMGNPFLLASDFKPTVTIGVISGLHRYQGGTGPNQRTLSYPDCIQVDTPINPGNSGGPLFDENGLLVGINGRISVRDRGRVNTGVGFAVSINQIKNFLPGLLAGLHCEHGTMDMNAWKSLDPNLGRGEAIYVQGLLEPSVTYDAGLRLGDRLVSFNGRPIRWVNDLARDVGTLPSGYEVTLGYERFDETTRTYRPEAMLRFPLSPIDTGSKRNARPNVPDFAERPNFERLRKEEAASPKAAAEVEPEMEGTGEGEVPEGGDPEPDPKKVDPKKVDPKDLIPKLKPGKKPEKRDLDREEALFRYMDGVVAELTAKLGRTLADQPTGPRRLELETTAWSKGKSQPGPAQVLEATDDDLTWTIGDRKLTISRADGDTAESLRRELALNPLLRPHRLGEALRDAWLEGGVFVAGRVGFVVALRGAGKQALYLDRDGGFPIGYRYRSHVDGGVRDVRFVDFAASGGKWRPGGLEVRVDGELRLTARLKTDVAFGSTAPADLAVPGAEVERRIEPMFASVVKIMGASGLAGIPAYGTGLVVSADGKILTWDHVNLQGRIRVVLDDGSVFDAYRHKSHDKLGVTVLQLQLDGKDPKKLPIRPLVLPAERLVVAPGTPVLTLGNAFKLAEFNERVSLTFGVVVSTVRSDLRLGLRKFPFDGDVILVDAPSNPGSHGGGLFDLEGQLLGVLTPIFESSETNTQLSIAIPAHELAAFVALALGDRDRAAEIVNQQGEAERPRVPVSMGLRLFETGRQVSPPAYVDRVLPGGPAAKAGLRSDDLIVRINDYPVRSCSEFRRALSQFGPGDTVDVTFKRGDEVSKVSVKLEAAR